MPLKISILGKSGSGKSTLARTLGELYGLPVLHLDTVQFMENWVVRDLTEAREITERFLDENNGWVVDGNYTKFNMQRRLHESDEILYLYFNRFACLWRVFKRFKKYKNTSRPDIAQGCSEKLDFEFVMWVLLKGRTFRAWKNYKGILKDFGGKTTVIRNQRQLNRYVERVKGEL